MSQDNSGGQTQTRDIALTALTKIEQHIETCATKEQQTRESIDKTQTSIERVGYYMIAACGGLVLLLLDRLFAWIPVLKSH